MKLFILEYKYTMRTVQFNTVHDNELKVEMFTKRSELWGRIEHLQGIDSIYLDYTDLTYYVINLTDHERMLL